MHVKHENKIPPTISKDTSDDHKTYTVKKEKKNYYFFFCCHCKESILYENGCAICAAYLDLLRI